LTKFSVVEIGIFINCSKKCREKSYKTLFKISTFIGTTDVYYFFKNFC
jgi:hypothetical protein